MSYKHLRRLVHRLNRRFAAAVAEVATQLSHALHGAHLHRRHLHLARSSRRPRRWARSL
jgi:hypothetical protein